MSNREKIISAIEKAKKQSEGNAQDAIIVPFKEVNMILALLKEQKDMIPIQTVAEYLAQYTAPPVRSPLAVYGDLVKAWERFFEGLKKREKQDE